MQEALPWLEWPMKIITQFGDAIIYIVLIAIAYWIYNKKQAIIALYVLLTTSFLNFFIKILVKNPRPDQSLRLVSESGFSTPSGHAQGSTTVYGWIALHFKKIWLYIIIPLLVIVISFSRVFLGVHFIGDVILGVITGVVILAACYFGIPPLLKWSEQWSDRIKILVAESYGVIVFLLTFLLGLFTEWPPGDGTHSAQISAPLLIFPIIVWLEYKWVKLRTENIHWSAKLLRVIVGLIVIVGVFFGLDSLFDLIVTTNYVAIYFLSFLKYAVVVVFVGFLLPLLFVKVKIFSKEKSVEVPSSNIEVSKA